MYNVDYEYDSDDSNDYDADDTNCGNNEIPDLINDKKIIN